MAKIDILKLWENEYGNKTDVRDYAGRLMKKSACSNPNSEYHPTIDHIRPLSQGGSNATSNMIICHKNTNYEKADNFPHWKANGKRFKAKKSKNSKKDYDIVEY